MADISVIKLPNGNSYNLKDTTARSVANSAVPNTRTVNGKALSSNISLGAGDVGAYTKKETDTKINAAIASAYKYKGSVTADKLPTSGQVVGDVYNITNDSSYGKAGMNVAWNGTTWDALGSNVDLSNYVTTSDSRLSNARPANGGNASTVNGHTVNADVPAGAKFTDTTYSAATQSANGLMSAADKKAIDREFFRMVPKGGTYIPENADLNSIEYIKVGNYYNTFDRESTTIKNIPVIQSPYKAFMMYVLSPLLEVYDNESTDQWVYRLRIFVTYTGDDIFVQKVDSGATAGRFNYGPWVKMTNSNDLGAVSKLINDHIANKSNPHAVTKAQVGLGSVANLDQSKAIKSITRSGTTFTATALDGTTSTFTQQDTNTTYPVATSSADGLMSKSDKAKLDGIGTGSNVKSVNSKTGAVTLTKSDIGLGNVDNTADSAKSVKYAASAGSANAVAWGNVSGKPSTYPPSSHTHTPAQVGLGNVANLDQSKAIKSITRNGTTFTATALDGTTSTFTQQDTNTTYGVATTSANGLMSAADKAKLDGIGDNCDIRNYGGKGDGTTNDTKAFNDCMLANNVVYLPTGKGLNWVLDSITITDGQSVIGDGNTKITYSGSGDLFLITGSRVAFYGLNIYCTNHGNAFHIKNASATSYFYLTDIVVTGATHLWYDTGCAEKYMHLYVHNMTGHNMAGTAIDISKGFAFLFLDNVTGANLPAHASWPTFKFVGVEGLHMTHCEAEGGGVDGSNGGAYGFLFNSCQAVWLERCMADLCDSDGFRMDGAQNAYFYFNNCVSSLCFGNGILLNGHYIFMNGCFITGRKGFDKSIPGANGLYVFGSDVLVSTTNAFNMTGVGIVLASGQRNNIGSCEVSTCNAAILTASGASGIIHDIYLVDSVNNTVQDGSGGTVKYYYVYNGSMLSNV